MACKGDCCKRVAQLEAQAGTVRLERTVIRGGLEDLIRDLPTLDRAAVKARIEAVLARVPATP